MNPERLRRAGWPFFLVAACLLTAAFRFLALDRGFPNDHFVHLTAAAQMLLGDWPTRDFADPGMPLMYGASALAQLLLGRTLFAEAVLVAVAFGVAAALTASAVRDLTGSVLLAALAVVIEVAIFPRTYGYPKILLYAAGFVLFGRYVSRPTVGRMAAMAAAVAAAFLFRHDHGIYLGIGGALAVLLTPQPGRWSQAVRHAGVFVAMVLFLLLPYLIYVQLHGGLGPYLRTGIAFSRAESARQWHVWPSVLGPRPTQALLVYLMYAIPATAALVLTARRRHARIRTWVARTVPLIVVAVVVDYSFIRDPLLTRVPDAIVPAVMLGAWLTRRAWQATRRRAVWMSTAVVLVAMTAWCVVDLGNLSAEYERTGLQGRWLRLPHQLAVRAAELRARLTVLQVPRATVALRPFFAYVDRCTTGTDRLLVTGFIPDVPFFARRAFAAGQSTFVPGYFNSEEEQRMAVARLRRQRVPFAVFPLDYEFDEGFPLVAGYVRAHFAPLTDVSGIGEDVSLRIAVTRDLPAVRQDVETGWPCFR